MVRVTIMKKASCAKKIVCNAMAMFNEIGEILRNKRQEARRIIK